MLADWRRLRLRALRVSWAWVRVRGVKPIDSPLDGLAIAGIGLDCRSESTMMARVKLLCLESIVDCVDNTIMVGIVLTMKTVTRTPGLSHKIHRVVQHLFSTIVIRQPSPIKV